MPDTFSDFRFLTCDEGAFIEAACSRVLDFEQSQVDNFARSEAAYYVDRNLVRESSSRGEADTARQSRSSLYRGGIAAVQAYCLRVYDARFQHLEPRLQDTTLALVEDGRVFGEAGQFQTLTSMLVADAVDSYFEASIVLQPGKG